MIIKDNQQINYPIECFILDKVISLRREPAGKQNVVAGEHI